MERIGISRATLNNYISSGLVARPQVLPPGPADGSAPRIGYFPDGTVERIETIQRLKREGWSISRIAQWLSERGKADHRIQGGAQPAAGVTPEEPPLLAAAGPAAAPATAAPPARGLSPTGAAAPDQERPRTAATPPLVATPPATVAAPALCSIAVLFTTLEGAPGLWLRLPADEYFDLLNEVWAELDPVLRRFQGQYRSHPDLGLACWFLPKAGESHLWNALQAALQLRRAMRPLSRRWQARKGWDLQLCLNTGIEQGEEWLGAVGPAGRRELRLLGAATERAEEMSRCGRNGMILVTREFLGKLAPEQSRRVHYGMPLADGATPSHLLLSFTSLGALAASRPVPSRCADLSVAELLDLDGPTTPAVNTP